MARELVLAREGGAAGADPAVLAAVLLVRLEVRHHGEALGAALGASQHLGAVAAPVVVLHAEHGLEGGEAAVLLVALAARVGAAEPGGTRGGRGRGRGREKDGERGVRGGWNR